MKFIKIAAIAACSALLIASCNNDDDSTSTSKSMTGSLEYDDLPTYVSPGMQFDFDASSVGLAEDETDTSIVLSYIYKCDITGSDTLDVATYTFTVPDTLAAFTFTVTVKASGYYSKSASVSSTIVSDQSVSYIQPMDRTRQTDSRDGSKYYTVSHDDLTWTASNLTYGGRALSNSDAALNVFGGFYNWEEAQASCPEGWSIPTLDQWDALGTKSGDFMCDSYFNGEKMWEFWPAVDITNSTSMSAIPAGYAVRRDTLYNFTGLNAYAVFWADNNGAPSCRYIYAEDPDVKTFIDVDPKNFYANLRCVKNN